MQKSPAWKTTLLNEVIPKFTAAIQSASSNTDDTTELQQPARELIKVVQDIVFAGQSITDCCDPQEESKGESTESDL